MKWVTASSGAVLALSFGFFKRHVSVGHAVPWFGVVIPREYFLAIAKLFVQMLCDTKPRCRTFSPVSHGAQYLTVLVSHGLSISASISPQYLMTLQYLTPVSHASSISTFLHNISTFFKFRSISKSQDLNFSGQDLTQNGDLSTCTSTILSGGPLVHVLVRF